MSKEKIVIRVEVARKRHRGAVMALRMDQYRPRMTRDRSKYTRKGRNHKVED